MLIIWINYVHKCPVHEVAPIITAYDADYAIVQMIALDAAKQLDLILHRPIDIGMKFDDLG